MCGGGFSLLDCRTPLPNSFYRVWLKSEAGRGELESQPSHKAAPFKPWNEVVVSCFSLFALNSDPFLSAQTTERRALPCPVLLWMLRLIPDQPPVASPVPPCHPCLPSTPAALGQPPSPPQPVRATYDFFLPHECGAHV